MKTMLTLSVLGLLLMGCTKDGSDASNYRRAVGVWVGKMKWETELRSNGVAVYIDGPAEDAKGTWLVKGGYLITDMKWDDGSRVVDSNKIFSVSENTLVVLSMGENKRITLQRR